MRNKKIIVIVCLLSLILVSLLFGCTEKERTLEFPDKPSQEIALNKGNFVSELTKYCHSHATFRLTEDIILTEDWCPIGQTVSSAFNGTIEGDGFSIIGLKTKGWEDDGTPVTILKRILGWDENGQPVYKSSQAVDMKTQMTNGFKEVTEIIYEGDDTDPRFISMSEKGVTENKASYGSLGLFGYTDGATINNIKIVDADLRFYADGDNVYVGFVSGYDIGSDFKNITVKDSYIRASTIERTEITYHAKNAKPSTLNQGNALKQYMGGIVGYSTGNTICKNDGAIDVDKSVYDNITIDNIVIDNNNFSAIYDMKLNAVYSDTSSNKSNIDSLILITELTEEEGRGVYRVDDYIRYPKQSFVGAITGYSVKSEFKNIDVDGLNKNGESKFGPKISAGKINVGGITSSLIGADSSATNVKVNNTHISGGSDATIAVTVGGAFGEVKSGSVSGCEVNNSSAAILGKESHIEAVCIGGAIAFCDEDASVRGINVDTVYLESNYAATGNMGSILAGIVGVLRDSTLNNSTAKNITFNVNNTNTGNRYIFTRTAVAQIYGNSVISENVKTFSCKYYQDSFTEQEYSVVKPVIAKNNYVNEDGESSARLYYAVDNETAGVYVTVYADLIPLVKGSFYRLRKEKIYNALSESKLSELKTAGTIPTTGEYYFYEPINKVWQNIQSTADETVKNYVEGRLYGTAEEVYRVELPESEIGKNMAESMFYTFNAEEGKLILENGPFASGKTYYIKNSDADIGAYELDITVYTESDKIIEATKSVETKEVSTYHIEKSEYKGDIVISDNAGTDVGGLKAAQYSLCPAEIYKDVYFEAGKGFRADINGYAVSSSEGNRNYAQYKLVDGRPDITEGAITYKSTEE